MTPRWLIAILVLVMLCTGCLPVSVREAISSDRREHDRAVADLERRATEEDGWLVLRLPNLHEGGGSITWWLHPCDPDGDVDRVVTRTAYHSTDLADVPGSYEVETGRLRCRAPATEVEIVSRRLSLDVPVVHLGGSTFGLLDDRERVAITDVGDGAVLDVERAAQPVHGPCDGRAHWNASLHSVRALDLSVTSCAGDLAALPEGALQLLDLEAGSDARRSSSAAIVNGHLVLPAGGHGISPAVDSSSPRLRT